MTHDELPDSRITPGRDRRGLVAFAALTVLAGLGLAIVSGPPRLPAGPPRIEQLVSVLAGSTLPVEPVVLVLVDAAWVLWLWIVASFGLQLLVELANAIGHGAVWVGALRRVADRLTLPLVRRTVAAAFAVQVLSRGVPLAAAEPLHAVDSALVSPAPQPPPMTRVAGADDEAPPGPAYIVRAGDTLWSIADRAYGSGTAYRRLVEANVGRRMPDGQVFSGLGVIRPGWELLVPEFRSPVQERDGTRWYTVERGDTLSAIAASILGDESRWTELFELNRGAPTPDGAHALIHPNVIWPGLRLRLPAEAEADADAEAATPSPSEQAVHVPQAAPAQLEPAPYPDPEPEPELVIAGLPLIGVDPPPLLRSPHALEPIALEPTDLASLADDACAMAADAEDAPPGAPPSSELPVVTMALGGAGIVALAGAALGARHVRRLRRLDHQRESEVVVEGGFAEAQLTHAFAPGLHGVGFDPVTAVIGRLVQFLDEYNLDHVRLVTVRHGRSATTLTLAASLADQPLLVDLSPVFADQLQADAEAWVSADQDVVIRLSRPNKTRLLPSATISPLELARLLPVGVLYDRQVFSVTWSSLGHVLIASSPGHGADTILTSLVAALTAQTSPEQLQMWIIGGPRSLPAPLFEVPHLEHAVDPGDEGALDMAVERLRAALDERAVHAPAADLVVVVPELTTLGDHAASIELLGARAADLRVRFIAATSNPDQALLSPLMSHFATRLVLRMHDEETSVALLGVADAAFLGGGGRMLLRLDGREPVELYGYQVATEHLERLVRVMRSAHPSRAAPATPHPQPTTPEPHSDATAPEPTAAAPQSITEAEPTAAEPHSVAAEPEPVAVEPEPTTGQPPSVTGAPLSQSLASGPQSPASEPQSTASEPQSPTPPAAAVLATPGSPIEVRCFGGPRVLCVGQQVWPRMPAGEVKPWELLLYLACQSADGVSSFDALEALWPDDDEVVDGPHRFRQLRYRLRRMLTAVAGAPATDGICLERGVLRLDPGVVHSDATEFLDLVRSARIATGSDAVGDLERARALYVGDLLDGPDARRYAWVDERGDSGVTLREHFRRLFEQASARLADLYAASGELDAAVDLFRELTELDPGDERLWRALFRLHADRGDRLALVREDHRMRELLRELAIELDAADGASLDGPSPETAQEYQRLLTGLRDRDRAPATA